MLSLCKQMIVIKTGDDNMADCKGCPSQSSCGKSDKDSCGVQNNPLNNVKHIIGVMSGKGGVGKSTVSTMLAKDLIAKGFKVGIMDADITGPSIPRLLGIADKRATVMEQGIVPYIMKDGLKVISLNLLIEEEKKPVIWRGPMIAKMVQQFWTDVIWEDLDYLIIDMPPGTGDVALTVMQMIPLEGVVMVSVPQDMISMIVAKAINMAQAMEVKVLGVVENMSYIQCPDCDKKIRIFEGDVDDFLKEHNLPLFGEIPMNKAIINVHENIKELPEDLYQIFDGISNEVIKVVENN